jgi:hypothetical protein
MEGVSGSARRSPWNPPERCSPSRMRRPSTTMSTCAICVPAGAGALRSLRAAQHQLSGGKISLGRTSAAGGGAQGCSHARPHADQRLGLSEQPQEVLHRASLSGGICGPNYPLHLAADARTQPRQQRLPCHGRHLQLCRATGHTPAVLLKPGSGHLDGRSARRRCLFEGTAGWLGGSHTPVVRLKPCGDRYVALLAVSCYRGHRHNGGGGCCSCCAAARSPGRDQVRPPSIDARMSCSSAEREHRARSLAASAGVPCDPGSLPRSTQA